MYTIKNDITVICDIGFKDPNLLKHVSDRFQFDIALNIFAYMYRYCLNSYILFLDTEIQKINIHELFLFFRREINVVDIYILEKLLTNSKNYKLFIKQIKKYLYNVMSFFLFMTYKVKKIILNHASVSQRNNKEIVRASVEKFGFALKYASEELRAEREIVEIAVKNNGLSLEFASEELRADKEIVKIAVKQNGLALQYASEKLRAYKEIVKIAVLDYGYALEFASKELHADKEIVKITIKYQKTI